MTERKRKAPRSLERRRILEVEYDGGVGAKELFRLTVTLADSAERIDIETMHTEAGAVAARRAKGASDAWASAMDSIAQEKRRAGLTAVERRVYEVCFAHVEAVEVVEDGEVYEALLDGERAWNELSFDGRLAWAQLHPGLWKPVQEAIMPASQADIEGKRGGPRAAT